MTAHLLVVAGRERGKLKAFLADTLTTVNCVIENYSESRHTGARPTNARPDLILLDLSLPDDKGLRICRDLYYSGVRAPVLLLSANEAEGRGGTILQEPDRGESGEPEDLLSNVRMLLTRISDIKPANISKFLFGTVQVDFADGSVTRDGMPVQLSAKQFELLQYLISWRGSALPRRELLSAVWGYRASATRTLDVHISVLRQKLEENPHKPRYILTLRGKGYMFLNEAKTSSD